MSFGWVLMGFEDGLWMKIETSKRIRRARFFLKVSAPALTRINASLIASGRWPSAVMSHMRATLIAYDLRPTLLRLTAGGAKIETRIR